MMCLTFLCCKVFMSSYLSVHANSGICLISVCATLCGRTYEDTSNNEKIIYSGEQAGSHIRNHGIQIKNVMHKKKRQHKATSKFLYGILPQLLTKSLFLFS